MTHSVLYQFLLIIWSLSAAIQAFGFFMLFKKYRNLYVLITESIKDSNEFMVILAYICMTFAFIGQLMVMGVINSTHDLSLVEYSLGVFLEALGDFERPTVENTPQPYFRFNVWIMFLLLQMITNVVALNTLIAIIGDSYERVQNDRESYDALQRVELLDELNDFYMLFKRAERRLVYLNVVSYASSGEDENN